MTLSSAFNRQLIDNMFTGERDQGQHQVPAEEGAVLGSCCWQCQHARQGAVCEHPDVSQLLGVAAEEELAECALLVHQEHHGKADPAILDVTSCLQWLR